ncbi:hypothetical protein Q8A67_025225 [Cirrhinus molitorella]|uniref:Uncharacterized protein n=1 Tax=Cirrhinus molitorella TaxID=172907 RepID=A0AA88P7Y9_9TELE|nr:hypothetical protein Q8A67_025225 [Cirrhinus molitorella]
MRQTRKEGDRRERTASMWEEGEPERDECNERALPLGSESTAVESRGKTTDGHWAAPFTGNTRDRRKKENHTEGSRNILIEEGSTYAFRSVDLVGRPGVYDTMEVGSETCQHLCPHHHLYQQQQVQQKRKTVTHALEDQKKSEFVSEQRLRWAILGDSSLLWN